MPKIDSSYFGVIIVDGKKYNKDIVISWDGEIEQRNSSHSFTKSELQTILMKQPEVVVIGTGTVGNVKIEPDAEVLAKIEGVELINKITPQAIEEFNKLSRRKKVIGVMHLTC